MRPDIGQKCMLCSVGDARQHFSTRRCGENLQVFSCMRNIYGFCCVLCTGCIDYRICEATSEQILIAKRLCVRLIVV